MSRIIPRLALLCTCAALAVGADDCSPDDDCSCFEYGGVASEISDNHGHELDVPPEDFTDAVAEQEYSYAIAGSADHDHSVTFTGEQLVVVSGLNSATVTSTETDGHTHEVTLDCGCS